jgi:cytoskeletal protein CcmA (bactofilin family)
MSLGSWGKNKKNKGEAGLNTIIGKGSVIEGTLEVEGELRIDGMVKGKISSTESLTIGNGGIVEGELNTKIVVIGGSVIGNVFALEKAELQSKAVIEGDITTKNLIVEEGAIFHGKCNMRDIPQPSEERKKIEDSSG